MFKWFSEVLELLRSIDSRLAALEDCTSSVENGGFVYTGQKRGRGA